MFGFLGKLFVSFLAVVAALAGLGWLNTKRDVKKGRVTPEQAEKDVFPSEKVLGNIHNLNDQFNRARYMDKDGQ